MIFIYAYHIKAGHTCHLSDQQASTERLTLVGFLIPFPRHYRHYKCLHLSVFNTMTNFQKPVMTAGVVAGVSRKTGDAISLVNFG